MDEIEDVFVARLMSTGLHTVTPDTLVEDAAAVLLDNDISSVLVVDDDGGLVGILTSTDFVDIVAKSQPKAETTVERYMTRDPITAGAQDDVAAVAATMLEHGFHHVPVVDGETPIGIITTSDFAAYVSSPESVSA
ncbi:histidine kinase [Halorubrum sp. E3]|uniref:Signal transduction protein with CBS domains n=5 Tax=Halorubrum distributum TaxID=29283 RepID=M0ECG7_9EURY|nr:MULTISPECIES: CBS domain-containing protein [Halorubrum distributum group]OYR89417.1 histidine kinase [Halorubrum sp. E3]ELZ30694.1 signal transduction protein with CBS domains [Halorubrum terrestre JCM 10247]ELZ45465.1 signal transduction protein with CBS domains [Halorubrum distributum JCM 9100]ELZ50531.1 signal transduction protein with CBS domains [Halorubrum distributum JCM 10118]EMA70883.1 signal transduction protein with CBS domains [Halorubrum arcis JCM 13916]